MLYPIQMLEVDDCYGFSGLFLLSLIVELFVIFEDPSYLFIVIFLFLLSFAPHGGTDNRYALPFLDMNFIYKRQITIVDTLAYLCQNNILSTR